MDNIKDNIKNKIREAVEAGLGVTLNNDECYWVNTELRRPWQSHAAETYGRMIHEIMDSLTEEGGEPYSDGWIQRLDEECDNACMFILDQFLILAACSDHDAAIEEFGTESATTKDGDINWTFLAFGALRDDVLKEWSVYHSEEWTGQTEDAP